jgi:transposase
MRNKTFLINAVERKTLEEMAVCHPHQRVRLRANCLLDIASGKNMPDVSGIWNVSHSALQNWRIAWARAGIVGILNTPYQNSPHKMTREKGKALVRVLNSQNCSLNEALAHLESEGIELNVHRNTAANYLKKIGYHKSAKQSSSIP